MAIAFTKTKLPFGWLGNMSSFPIIYRGMSYRTAEALFQALRFKDQAIIQEIAENRSPMGAKFVAKAHQDKMLVQPGSKEDIANMEMVLRLKLSQHSQIQEDLLATGDEEIIEDCTNRAYGRNLLWGAAFLEGVWQGENILGKLWMKLRQELAK